MNAKLIAAVAVLTLAAPFSYAGGSSEKAAVSGLLSLDEAIEGAAAAIEERVSSGTEIAVYKITAPHDEIGEHLAEDLNDKISMRGNLVPLAREAALQYVDTEHQFQMSGLVSDESAVGIGHYLGAKVVITGTFDRYADFSQFRLRAIDVRTSALLYSYTSRINNGDRVLANITAPFTLQAPRVTENALARLNRGKDLWAEGKLDEAIAELDKAIAINRDLAEAYFYRGFAYGGKGDIDRVITNLDQAIRLDPNYKEAYDLRAFNYIFKNEYNKAFADLEAVVRLDPNYALRGAIFYYNSAVPYFQKGEYDKALVLLEAAIRLDPNNANVKRGLVSVYYDRSLAYYKNDDLDRALADLQAALRIDPNNANVKLGLINVYNDRSFAYFQNGDLDRALADLEAILRIDPNDADAKLGLEVIRQQRGNRR